MTRPVRKDFFNTGGQQPATSGDKEQFHRNLAKAALLAAFLVAALALIRFSPLGDYLKISNVTALQQRLAEFSRWAPVIFLLGGAVLIALGAPRSLISILGGMVFGLFQGVVLALAASLLGSMAIFWLTRLLGRPLFKQKTGSYQNIIEQYSKSNGFLLVILLRQLPLTCILVNVLIGLTSITTGAFLLGSIVGLLPETVIFALYGSSLQTGFVLRISVASFLLVLLVLIVRIYYQRSALAREISQKLKKTSQKG